MENCYFLDSFSTTFLILSWYNLRSSYTIFLSSAMCCGSGSLPWRPNSIWWTSSTWRSNYWDKRDWHDMCSTCPGNLNFIRLKMIWSRKQMNYAFLVPYQSNHNVSFNNYSEILILTLMKENVSNAVNAKNLFPIYEG